MGKVKPDKFSMEKRLYDVLRLNPEFVQANSFRLVPFGDKLLATWTGMALLEPADIETLAAAPPEPEPGT